MDWILIGNILALVVVYQQIRFAHTTIESTLNKLRLTAIDFPPAKLYLYAKRIEKRIYSPRMDIVGGRWSGQIHNRCCL